MNDKVPDIKVFFDLYSAPFIENNIAVNAANIFMAVN